MIDIKEEIQIALLRKGLSMRKLSAKMRAEGFDIPEASGLSIGLNKKRIRFNTVQEILDYLGYELKIVEKSK